MSRRTEASSAIEAAASDWIVRRDTGLSPREAEEFARWRAADPRHAAAVARHDQAWSLLDGPRTAGRTGEFERALRGRASRRRRRAVLAVGVAAALVLGFFRFQPAAPDRVELPRTTAVVLAPRIETLPDGTVVELKAGAAITADYAGPLRRVRLERGEAWFRVAKNPARAFVVSAAGVEVRAVGTAFLVDLGQSQVDVIVTEGRVAIEKAAGAPAAPAPGPGFSTLVDAGRRVVVDHRPGPLAPEVQAVSADEIAERLVWRETRLEFSYTPLAEAVALMNRHSRLRLVIDDPELAGLPVNGLFRADNAETLLRLLEANFDVVAARAGDTITLRKAR